MGAMAATRMPREHFEGLSFGLLPGEVTGPQVSSWPNLWSDTSDQIISATAQRERGIQTLAATVEARESTPATQAGQILVNDGQQTTLSTRSASIVFLREAAEATDYRTFAALVRTMDWANRPPDELLTAIDLAYSLEMATLTMELAELAGCLFPNHEKAQRAARILAPPVARSVHPQRAKGLDASMAWIEEHANEYRGQWVAVREGRLLGAAGSLEELMPLVGEGEDAISTVVTRVL